MYARDLHESLRLKYLHARVDPAPAWIGSEPTDHDMTRSWWSGRACIASPKPGQGVNVAIARRLEKKRKHPFRKRNFPKLSTSFQNFSSTSILFPGLEFSKTNSILFPDFPCPLRTLEILSWVDGYPLTFARGLDPPSSDNLGKMRVAQNSRQSDDRLSRIIHHFVKDFLQLGRLFLPCAEDLLDRPNRCEEDE